MKAGGAPSGRRFRIVFHGGAAGDWGGASRVMFNSLRMMDRTTFEPAVLLPRPGPAAALLDGLGIRWLIWPEVPNSASAVQRYGRVAAAVRMLRDLGADLLDVNLNFWRPPEVLAARLLRIPVVRHYHLVFPQADFFLRFSSAVTAVSQYAAQRSAFAGRRVEVIPNTVVVDRFDRASSLRPELGLTDADVVVAFVGQIRENKGIDTFLRMAHALPSPRLRFLVVGECRDPRTFEGTYDIDRLRREIGADHRVLYLGYREDVERVFRTSDIVVVPSRWGEPFGLVNIEAGAAGVPVVAMRDGGIPEVIRDGENGLVVDVGDEAGPVAAVQRLAESPALRGQLGRQGREIIERQFTEAPVRRLERLHLDLLGR